MWSFTHVAFEHCGAGARLLKSPAAAAAEAEVGVEVLEASPPRACASFAWRTRGGSGSCSAEDGRGEGGGMLVVDGHQD